MKTQNTLENKTKFFAQYWGQDLLCRVIFGKNKNEIIMHNTPCSNLKLGEIIDSYLELKPLSQISDEDVIQGITYLYNKTYEDLGEILEVKHYNTFSSITTTRTGENFKTYRSIHHWKGTKRIRSAEADYLRSKGYALSYMDLSVEDLVEYGWIKLKEN